MKLLIDYLEDSSAYIRERKQTLHKLERQYRQMYSRDTKKEMHDIEEDIRRKQAELTQELLTRLEELRFLKKYFPDLLQTYMEDEYVGKTITRKAWLLDFQEIPPQQAAAGLAALRAQRAKVRQARNFVKRWVGPLNMRSFLATYPFLRGQVRAQMDKEDVLAAVDKADRVLRRQGWLLLLTQSLIGIPLAKFMARLAQFRYQEAEAQRDCQRTRGQGSVAEVGSLRKLEKARRGREHYGNVLKQILLANPDYLRSIKKSRNWLSRKKETDLQRLAETVNPFTVHERAWLDEMKKRLATE